ncbi:hypothetical protein B484DRAFT_418986 [Ochromonadaceae sp. CCMP2298]|nr:hypothetical protein B484DRAFT_418986 [Ochromonadaceae sp. CCMP2298]
MEGKGPSAASAGAGAGAGAATGASVCRPQSVGLSLPVLVGAGMLGGSLLLLTVLSAPFLIVPASRKLGSLPWMATPEHQVTRALQQIERLRGAREMGKGGMREGGTHTGKAGAYSGSSSSSSSTNTPNTPTPTHRRLLVDLGSGDGRVCTIASRDFGYSALGLELNPVLIGLAYWRAAQAQYACRVGAVGVVGTTVGAETAGAVTAGNWSVLSNVRFSARNFWHLPLTRFDVVTVFGVRSIMQRLEEKLLLDTGVDGGVDAVTRRDLLPLDELRLLALSCGLHMLLLENYTFDIFDTCVDADSMFWRDTSLRFTRTGAAESGA